MSSEIISFKPEYHPSVPSIYPSGYIAHPTRTNHAKVLCAFSTAPPAETASFLASPNQTM